MKCNRCGSEVMDGQNACPHCGNMMQPGISMTHMNESGQTVTGTITSNGLGLNVSAAPIKNSKVALIVSCVIAAVSVIVLGVGIFLAVNSGNKRETGKDGESGSSAVVDDDKASDDENTSASGEHTLSCVQKGTTSEVDMEMTFADGKLSVIEYDFAMDTEETDELTFVAALMAASFESLKGEWGVSYNKVTSGSKQVLSYSFTLSQMDAAALSQLGGGDDLTKMTWKNVDAFTKEVEAEGFSCTKK